HTLLIYIMKFTAAIAFAAAAATAVVASPLLDVSPIKVDINAGKLLQAKVGPGHVKVLQNGKIVDVYLPVAVDVLDGVVRIPKTNVDVKLPSH
ncbi:hypothetical protein EV182_001545, partial [Spiromyces aspiralis]